MIALNGDYTDHKRELWRQIQNVGLRGRCLTTMDTCSSHCLDGKNLIPRLILIVFGAVISGAIFHL